MTAKSEQTMAEIERQIARTRADLGATLDAAAVELAPRHLVEQGVEMITDFLSANRPDGISFGAALRADPVPLALIGLGAAWLVAENLGLISGIKIGDRSTHTAGPEVATHQLSDHSEPASVAAESDTGQSWVHRAAGAAQGAVKSIVTDGGSALGRAGDYLGRAMPTADTARRAGGWVKEGNPLLLGALGLAAGAALAMLLPVTRRERQIVDEAREDLWEKAELLGHRASEGVRSLAETANRSGREE